MSPNWFAESARLEKELTALRAERDALQARERAMFDALSAAGISHGGTLEGLREGLSVVDALRSRVKELEGLRPEFPPLPPNGHGLLRYGLRWPPRAHQAPLAVPMPDGYWTPWHLAESALKAEQTAHAATRAEVERLRTALLWMISEESDWDDGEIGVGHKFRHRARLALDGVSPTETPAPRTFTEEQVREFGERVREAAAAALIPKADWSIAARVLVAFCQGVIRRIDLKALLETP